MAQHLGLQPDGAFHFNSAEFIRIVANQKRFRRTAIAGDVSDTEKAIEWLNTHHNVAALASNVKKFDPSAMFTNINSTKATSDAHSFTPHIGDIPLGHVASLNLSLDLRKHTGAYAFISIGDSRTGKGHQAAAWIARNSGTYAGIALFFDPNFGDIYFESRWHFYEFMKSYQKVFPEYMNFNRYKISFLSKRI